MVRKAIRHLAPARDTPLVAAGEFDKWVSVWDTSRRAELSRFETVLDFGGRRLALSCSGRRCFAAGYRANCLACYDASAGDQLWKRRNLKHVQRIRVSANCHDLYCSFNGRASLTIDGDTGEDVQRHKGVNGIYESDLGPLLVLEKRNCFEVWLQSREKVGKIGRNSFGTLDVAFSPDLIAISEAGKPVRFLGITDSRHAAHYTPPANHHVLKLAFSPEANCFLGIEWNYQSGGSKRLIRLADTGDAHLVALIGEPAEAVFLNRGAQVLTTDGTVFDTATGQMLHRLPFPLSDAWN
jgi:hypothetical protein